jgi:hypothetical protein
MLVPKLCKTRRLRRTQAPTFMRYMNRARRGIQPPDIGTEPDKATTALGTLRRRLYPALAVRKPPSHANGSLCAIFKT